MPISPQVEWNSVRPPVLCWVRNMYLPSSKAEDFHVFSFFISLLFFPNFSDVPFEGPGQTQRG